MSFNKQIISKGAAAEGTYQVIRRHKSRCLLPVLLSCNQQLYVYGPLKQQLLPAKPFPSSVLSKVAQSPLQRCQPASRHSHGHMLTLLLEQWTRAPSNYFSLPFCYRKQSHGLVWWIIRCVRVCNRQHIYSFGCVNYLNNSLYLFTEKLISKLFTLYIINTQ